MTELNIHLKSKEIDTRKVFQTRSGPEDSIEYEVLPEKALSSEGRTRKLDKVEGPPSESITPATAIATATVEDSGLR